MNDLWGKAQDEKFKPIWRKRHSPQSFYLTPRYIIDAVGPFDLDPCAAEHPPFQTATTCYTEKQNGLKFNWRGRVWLNPPHDTQKMWMRRLMEHGDGIAMIFATVETRNFFDFVWNGADGIFFFKGRIKFLRPNGGVSRSNCSSPSSLVAYGARNVTALKNCKLEGRFIEL